MFNFYGLHFVSSGGPNSGPTSTTKLLCGFEEKWLRVRHLPQNYGKWHPVNDKLM